MNEHIRTNSDKWDYFNVLLIVNRNPELQYDAEIVLETLYPSALQTVIDRWATWIQSRCKVCAVAEFHMHFSLMQIATPLLNSKLSMASEREKENENFFYLDQLGSQAFRDLHKSFTWTRGAVSWRSNHQLTHFKWSMCISTAGTEIWRFCGAWKKPSF